MLIKNREQQEAKSLKPNEVCGYCKRDLTYPVVVGSDYNKTVYRAACALQFATEMMNDLGDLVRPLQKEPLLSPMEAAFREAAHRKRT